MLRRSTKIQLVLFVIMTFLGVTYVGAEYVGLTPNVLESNGCTVNADFPDSGGIFTDAEVTYRGVTVGKVGSLTLIDKGTEHGVRVSLDLEDCHSAKIPTSTKAEVSDRSVIGEQYVNLLPPNDAGPYLRGGDVIPMSRNAIPVSPETLLTNLDALVKSVNTTNLQTVVAELGTAFNGEGENLGSLLDSTNILLNAAEQNITPTLALIQNANEALSTQLDEAGPFASFTKNLNLISQQLKASNPDIEHLLDTGPADLGVVQSFITNNKTDLGVTLANLATTGNLIVRRLPGVEQVLELYPLLAAGGQSVLKPAGDAGVIGRLGLVLNNSLPNQNPATCGSPSGSDHQGYGGTQRRDPADTSPAAPNVAAQCTATVGSGVDVRGAANVPGGDPVSASGGGVAYPRAATANTVSVGVTSSNALELGDNSWLAMLTNGLDLPDA
jgi:phospholipid/cholesterol/gamma-HCH transport system substrate-binding protein